MSLKSDAIVERIRVRLGKIDPANRQVLHTYKCKITSGGKVAKTWMLDLVNVKLYEGNDAAECTLECDDQAFADIADQKLQAKEALEKGLLKVEDNMELALKLMPFIATV